MTDVWDKIEGGAKITRWCMRNEFVNSKSCSKRVSTEDEKSTAQIANFFWHYILPTLVHNSLSHFCRRVHCLSADASEGVILPVLFVNRVMAEEHEQELQEKRGTKYTRFQYKLWAEMLASGVHDNMDYVYQGHEASEAARKP